MKPTIGRIVIVKGPRVTANGVGEVPAVITRVHGDHDTKDAHVLVNLTCFLDLREPVTQGSVPLCETQDEAEKLQRQYPHVAWWPGRT